MEEVTPEFVFLDEDGEPAAWGDCYSIEHDVVSVGLSFSYFGTRVVFTLRRKDDGT